jgi:hypothetical protein
VIAADGELNAARALKEAAETISKSSTAMQLRYLQTLNIIANERGSTILFPLPIDILGPMVCLPVSSFVFHAISLPQGQAMGAGASGFPPVNVESEKEDVKSFI